MRQYCTVIPAYNNEATIGSLVSAVRRHGLSVAVDERGTWLLRAIGEHPTEEQNGWFPSTERLIDATRAVKQEADRHGIVLDNAASFELRANAPAGVKFDLGNAGWQSLCVYADGQVYPSAAFANHKPLWCGDATNGMTLEQIWRNSPVLQQIRDASVIRKRQASDDPFRYLTGDGDIEHSYFFSGDFVGDDPYYPLYQALLLDAMDVLTARKAALANRRSGYDAPRIFHAMGDGAVVCGTTEVSADEVEVAFLHSNCVLSFDVEKPRKIVQQFYGQAAEQPQAELCCPTKYDPAEVGHIPQEVLDRFYGCGSPVTTAHPQLGETYVDLGSGAGIDCFIAAKHVGPTGTVIGVDMTEQMLAVANDSGAKVAAALGYDVVEFRKGYLEQVPVEGKTADVVTSNCVINLSPDKPTVLAEIWRILKDHGRTVIADIVSDREVPPRLKVNEQLWGECIVGALTEEQFLAMLEQAGFYGLSVLKKTFWKQIEGFKFYSVTVQGFKFEKTVGCQFIGQSAIYRGPCKAVLDEEGHAGRLTWGLCGAQRVMVFEGRIHCYEGYSAAEVAYATRLLARLGAKRVIITNIAGGLDPEFHEGDPMLITDHMNLMGVNPLVGSNDDTLGPRFPDMSEPYNRSLLAAARTVAEREQIPLREGVYVGVLGPHLETRAEYRYLRMIGADAVGMSTIPEVIAAVHAGLQVLGISLISDRCVPETLQPVDIQKLLQIAREAEPVFSRLLSGVLRHPAFATTSVVKAM